MKKILLSLAFIGASFLSLAQVDVQVGNTSKAIKTLDNTYISIGGDVYTAKVVDEDVHISKINSKTLDIEMTMKSPLAKGACHEGVWLMKNNLFLFYSLWDQSNRVEQLFYQTINLNTCQLSSTPKLLISVKTKLEGSPILWGAIRVGVKNKFDFNKSLDDERLLVRYALKSDQDANPVIGLNVFDSELKPLSTAEVEIPYLRKIMKTLDYTIDNEGNAYILIKIEKDKKLANTIELLKIAPKSNKVVTIPIPLQNKSVNDMMLYQYSTNKIVGAGFYANELDGSVANGIMSFTLDKDNSVPRVTSQVFSKELADKFFDGQEDLRVGKRQKGNDPEIVNLKLNRDTDGETGSILLVGEQHYSFSTSSERGFFITHYYDDMLVCKLKGDGSVVWMQRLPKRQEGAENIELSYRYLKLGKEHTFIYVDDEANMTLKDGVRPVNHHDFKKGVMASYQLSDDKGEVKKTFLFNTKDVKGTSLFWINLKRMIPVNDKEFVLESYTSMSKDVRIKVKYK